MSTQDDQIQRLHYFNNQFLKAEDFTTEQEYHLEMRRRHNHVLHTKGVAEGLQIKKKDNKTITVKAGTAIDEDGNEIVLLKDLSISLADTIKFPKNSTIYIFASYNENKEKPQHDNSTDENQKTRFFENAVITVEIKEPGANDKIVRLGRLKFDKDGNVPDQDANVPDNAQFLNKIFREEAAAKLPKFYITIDQLKTELKAEKTESLTISEDLRVPVFETPVSLSSTTQNVGAFILVYAFSSDEGAIFTWSQEYRTERKKVDGKEILMQTQYVLFSNKTPPPRKPINITYKIYAVLAN